jgi:hypothetical protein
VCQTGPCAYREFRRAVAEALEDKASVEKWLNATFGSLLPVDSETRAALKKQ